MHEEGTMSKLHDVLMRQFENMDKTYEEYARKRPDIPQSLHA